MAALDRAFCGNCGAGVARDMNFCPVCGAPFKTTALPTPIYPLMDQPIPKPLPNRTAPLPMLTVNAFLWGFMAFMWCFPSDVIHHFSILQVIALFSSGAFIGFYFTRIQTLHQFGVLETKGEVVTSLRKTIIYLVFAILAVIIAGVLLFRYMPPNPPAYWYLSYNFLYSMPVSMWTTRAIMYYEWQKKNHKQIFWEKRKMVALPAQ